MLPKAPQLASLAWALASACVAWGCHGEEKTYTAGLVQGARAVGLQDTRQKLESLGSALERYALDHGLYPDASCVEDLETYLEPSYLRALPELDGWGRPLRLRSDASSFALSSDGPDGLPDTADDLRRESGGRVGAPHP